MSTEETIPVLLDTDIGSDIDDAVCLAYLLRQPRCELVGITTVSGQPMERAMLADAMCRAAGVTNIPIHSGAEEPLLVPAKQPVAPQAVVLDTLAHRTDFEPNTAVEFMRQTIRSRPGEITLLGIGPLTNIALLFATDSEIPAMLKQLVLMCGTYPSGQEWNAICDPHATAIVYNAPVKRHISIGLNVTLRCQMKADECRKKFTGSVLEAAAKMAEVWFKERDSICFHDPLAATVIFEPDTCKYESGKVFIDLSDEKTAGEIRWDTQTDDKPHTAAVDVDVERFFDHYFSIAAGN
ncbi:MAG: nucleoside hydrolase [Armatimonadota bacterium]|nr:nucleoside hydrolase [bacterium]